MSLGLPPNNLDPSNYRGVNWNVIPVVTALREPTVTDTNYPLFCEWRIGKNPTSGVEGDFWKLLRFNQGQAGWEKIASGATGSLITLSDTGDVIVSPDATGNIKLEGIDGIEVTSDPLTNKLTLALSGGDEAIDSVTPDTGVPIVADIHGNIDISGQSTPNTSGIETYNVGASELGLRLKSPFVGAFTFQSTTGGASETLLSENTVNQAGSTAIIATRVAGATSGDAYYQSIVDGVTSWSWGVDNSDSDAWVLGDGATLGGASTVMRADVSGVIDFPTQPAFLAVLTTTSAAVTGDGTDYTPIIFDTEEYDAGNNFDIATGKFTAPRTGVYEFTGRLRYSKGGTTATAVAFTLDIYTGVTNDSSYSLYTQADATLSGLNENSIGGSIIVPMTAGQTAQLAIRIQGNSLTSTLFGETTSAFNCYFSGAKIA